MTNTTIDQDQDKYYTPDIEDIRVGYECEIIQFQETEDGIKDMSKSYWELIIVGEDNIKFIYRCIEEYRDKIRTPYLTKEQIEAEGWKDSGYGMAWIEHPKTGKKEMSWLFEKGKTNLILNEYSRTINIVTNNNQLFKGECPSINELRYISKLLNIK